MSSDASLGDGVGRAALIGAGIGFATMAGTATAAGLVGGLPLITALGIGTFAAVWGGPGFGALFGAIVAITRNERLAAVVGDVRPEESGDLRGHP